MSDAPLTTSEISRSSRRMARPKSDHEPVLIRFVPGTREEIREVLHDGEDNASFVRLAVAKEIARRKRSTPRKPKPSP
ncbi:hypothetical protein [Methylorubrum extorquens]|nr:hypothetical protein [Methylorubrum extorquens]MCP1545288.1 hypothetical protein [Methylorubrum extorquens]MCP1587365.1 hypothetical protein [Methylorubrum extorquens]